MSDPAAKAFIDELTNQPDLAETLALKVGNATGDEARQRILAFASHRGHTLDDETIQLIVAAINDDSNGELSESQLEHVAGGGGTLVSNVISVLKGEYHF